MFKKNISFLFVILFFYSSFYQLAFADQNKPFSDTELTSANFLGSDIANWIEKMNPRPTSIAIFDIKIKSNLSQNFGKVLETEVLEHLSQVSELKIMQCTQCKSIKATVVEDQVVIRKGITNIDEYKKYAADLGVESFLLLEATRSTSHAVVTADLVSSAGQVLSSNTFYAPVFDLAGSSAMIGLSAAFGTVIGGESEKEDDLEGSGNVVFLQEIGEQQKGGLVLGGFYGNGSFVGYVHPTIAWKKNRAVGNLMGIAMLGLGPATSAKGFGLSSRFSYQLLFGFASIGLEAAGYTSFSGKKDNKKVPDAFLGLTIGLYLGR